MTVELRDTTAFASGDVGVEDAEMLDEWLVTGLVEAVELSDVTHLHGAALQLLLQHHPVVLGEPRDRFTAQLVSGLHGGGGPAS